MRGSPAAPSRDQLLLDRGGFVGPVHEPERVGQRPLVFGQWIEARGSRQRRGRVERLVPGELDAPSRKQRRGVVGHVLQRRVGHALRVGQLAALQLVDREPRVGPGDGLAIARAGRLDRGVHHLDRAAEVALEPAQMRRTGVGLVEGLEVDHLLIGLRRLRHPPLLHQHVAEQAVVEHELTRRHQPPRNRLGLAEAVHLVEHVAAQQQRGGLLRRDRLEARGCLLRNLVVARGRSTDGPGRRSDIQAVRPRALPRAARAGPVAASRCRRHRRGRRQSQRDRRDRGSWDPFEGCSTARCGERQDQGDRDQASQLHAHLQSHMSYYGREARLDVRRYGNPNRLSFRRDR